ncbi:50S ribosomal protein L18 [Eubacteriales bacterium OttesenSCG-928-N13]|nr:50S ribosomal protein L18 [Eubacteriales bacterium OttesenSCG-928-N13]
MFNKRDRNEVRRIRHARVRKKISGTPARPRLCVYRSLNHIYAQIIDDAAGNTLVAASTVEKDIQAQIQELDKKSASKIVGKAIAERAAAKGIKDVVFDRGGYIYTGRVAELAAGAREGGLDF